MKKKPKNTPVRNRADEVSALLEFAQASNLPDGALEDELWDACETDARLAHEQICGAVLMEQIEFLWDRGYAPSAIERIITELCKE